MNEGAMLHTPDSQYCFAVGEKELVIRLRMAKEDKGARVRLIYGGKYEFHLRRESLPMEICYTDRLYNYYEIRLRLHDVRLAYIFGVEEDGKERYFCEDGLVEEYDYGEGFYNFFQMPYINANDILPVVGWMRGAVFYQIFVDRFLRGDTGKNDDYVNMEWGELPTPKSFAGGDLRGIVQKLDYLRGLGISAIYLTPIFLSPSNHKYDTIDYTEVDAQFGGEKALRELVQKAHERGIRIVLDAVFNHCSMETAQFRDVLEKGKKSPYYGWFLIDGDFPNPEKRNYECFAECAYMPKFNTANEEVQEYLTGVGCYWIREYDIDGWRLDVSDEVSHAFWRRFRQAVKKEKPTAVIIGENWHNAYPYLQGDQYDGIMNYAFTKACLDYFARGKINARQMAEKLTANLMRNKENANRMMLNLLDSHDTHRFYTEAGNDADRVLAGLALEMVFPGAPCIYYGTEIGMEGHYDPDSRRCFDWDETRWNRRIFDKIPELTAVRRQRAAQYGGVRILEKEEMLCIVRTAGEERVTLYVNMTDGAKNTGECEPIRILSENGLERGTAGEENGRLLLGPRGYVILKNTENEAEMTFAERRKA